MFKNYLINIISFFIAFLAPIQSALLAIIFLIGADLIMGLIAAKKQKEKITSNRLSKTIIKLLVYELLIISSFICEKYLLPLIPLTSITLGFLGVIEFISIGENFTKITSKNFLKFLKEYIYKFRKSEIK